MLLDLIELVVDLFIDFGDSKLLTLYEHIIPPKYLSKAAMRALSIGCLLLILFGIGVLVAVGVQTVLGWVLLSLGLLWFFVGIVMNVFVYFAKKNRGPEDDDV